MRYLRRGLAVALNLALQCLALWWFVAAPTLARRRGSVWATTEQ